MLQTRYVVNFREPKTHQRKQLFFDRHKDALAMRDALVASVATDTYEAVQTDLTVTQVVDYWLQARRGDVKKGTWASYRHASSYITGPLLVGTKLERHTFTRTGKTPDDAAFVDMLGPILLADLTTADIRNWHRTLTTQVSSYTAYVAKKFLRAALALAAEDFQLRVPILPTQLGRGKSKKKKAILTSPQIQLLLQAAWKDELRGIYYAFPFLTGSRPSEQLALLWRDVDLEAGVVRIRRMQEVDCTLTELTKSAAGTRDVPISPLLRLMLSRWQQSCPSAGPDARVFPGLGNVAKAQHKKRGGPLSYANFLRTYWRPTFATLGLPYVTPHSARHSFISTLQAAGIEVGLVAKLAGHSNAVVTLAHYTQAVRGGEAALTALETAYGEIGSRTGDPGNGATPPGVR
jgi:integrase